MPRAGSRSPRPEPEDIVHAIGPDVDVHAGGSDASVRPGKCRKGLTRASPPSRPDAALAAQRPKAPRPRA
eukprot:11163845-Heterocapsa_arctica.AAC.1